MATIIKVDSNEKSLLVRASDKSGNFVEWHRPMDSQNQTGISFKCDQFNGENLHLSECTIDRDGIHIVFLDGRLVHFYFCALDRSDWDCFRRGLEQMYSGASDLLAFHY